MTKENQTQQPVSAAMTVADMETVRDALKASHKLFDGEMTDWRMKQVAKALRILSRTQDAQAIRNSALEALKANHEHHKTYDDYGGYPESELCEQNMAAIAALEALQSAHAQPVERPDAVAQGKALVPLIPNQAMRDVMDEEGWQWEDLLAAAEAITEEQHAAIAANQPHQVRGNAQPQVPNEIIRAITEYGDERDGGTNSAEKLAEVIKLIRTMLAAAPQVAQEEGGREKSYGRAEVQKWRDDIAHAAADMVQKALQHADGDWSWLSDSIRALASAPQPDAQQSSEKDAERLDWIEHQDFDELRFFMPRDMAHDGECCVMTERDWYYGKTLRDAIDAAIAKEQ